VVYRKGDDKGWAGHGGKEIAIFPQLTDINLISVEAAENCLEKSPSPNSDSRRASAQKYRGRCSDQNLDTLSYLLCLPVAFKINLQGSYKIHP